MQRQDSLHDQLKTVYQLAVDAYCYDAADFIRRQLEQTEERLKRRDVNLWEDVKPTPEQVKRYVAHLYKVSDELLYKIMKRVPGKYLSAVMNEKPITKRMWEILSKKRGRSETN